MDFRAIAYGDLALEVDTFHFSAALCRDLAVVGVFSWRAAALHKRNNKPSRAQSDTYIFYECVI